MLKNVNFPRLTYLYFKTFTSNGFKFYYYYISLKSPCNIWGQSHPKLIIFWAKVTPSLWSQSLQIFNFITSVGSEDLNFPKLSYLKFQNNYVGMSSALLALYHCLKSMFKVTEVVTYFQGTKSSSRWCDFGPALKIKKKCERIVTSNYNLFFIISFLYL